MRNFIRTMLMCFVILLLSASVVSAAKSGGYTYTTSGGKATITDVDTSIAGDVVIPSSLGGCPVTAIADNAFFLCKSITEVIIPDTVTSIGGSAFYECSSLEKIEIPTSVKVIKESAFAECKKLKDINIVNENTEISFTDGILYCDTVAIFCSNVYCTENNIKEIYIKEGTSRIGAYAFAKCDSIIKVELPESTAFIGDNAFEVCTNLKEVIILGNVTSIGEYAFMENFALESVTYNGTKEPVSGEDIFESCPLEAVVVPFNYEGYTFCGYPLKKTSLVILENKVIAENISVPCKLIVASYRGNELVDCVIKNISEDTELEINDVNTIRAFLWKDLINFKPLCQCEEK